MLGWESLDYQVTSIQCQGLILAWKVPLVTLKTKLDNMIRKLPTKRKVKESANSANMNDGLTFYGSATNHLEVGIWVGRLVSTQANSHLSGPRLITEQLYSHSRYIYSTCVHTTGRRKQ